MWLFLLNYRIKSIRIIWYPILETSWHALIFLFFPNPVLCNLIPLPLLDYLSLPLFCDFPFVFWCTEESSFAFSIARGSMTHLCLVKKDHFLKSFLGFRHTTFVWFSMFILLYIMYTFYDCFSYLWINYLPCPLLHGTAMLAGDLWNA